MNINQIQNLKNGDHVNIFNGNEEQQKLIVVRTDLADFCSVNFLYRKELPFCCDLILDGCDYEFIKLTVEHLLDDDFHFVGTQSVVECKL